MEPGKKWDLAVCRSTMRQGIWIRLEGEAAYSKAGQALAMEMGDGPGVRSWTYRLAVGTVVCFSECIEADRAEVAEIGDGLHVGFGWCPIEWTVAYK